MALSLYRGDAFRYITANMEKLTGKQKRYLASQAHHLEPVVMVGQKGITQGLIEALNQALDDHELIKVKFQDYKSQKKPVSDELAEKTDGEIIRIIGNILIIYRPQKDREKRKYFLP